MYRIVQESLTNALRHSPGAAVRVRIGRAKGAVTVHVDDDGPGPRVDARRGYGLVGVAERVQHLGGELTCGAGPGRGFYVHVRLPAPARHQA